MDIILGLIWVGTSHIRIGLDTAYYSESGRDTAHNITCYSESGGDTAQENVFRCSHLGGDTAQNSKTEGGTPLKGVGTPHITPHTIQNHGGTPHKKMCLDVHTGVGTPHRIQRQREGHRTKPK